MNEEKDLSDMLRAIVLEHGIKKVERVLGEIRKSARCRRGRRSQPVPSNQMPKSGTGQPKRTTTTALRYVSKLDVDLDVRAPLEEAATQYESKSFLPTVGEIRNFCMIHGIEVPASHSRASAIPRIFKHLSQLAPSEIHLILQSSVFSGPTRLAPIADAIRRSSEQRASEGTADRRTRRLLPNKMKVKKKNVPKLPIPKNI